MYLPDLAVRDGDCKLLCDFDGGRAELYNLEKNPEESINLASDYPDKVDRMTRRVTQWYRELPQLEGQHQKKD